MLSEEQQIQILLPAFAMFSLTTFISLRLTYLRYVAIRQGKIDLKFFKLFKDYDEPEILRVYSRHFINLLEAPVLFYVIIVITYVTGQTNLLLVILSWSYITFRIAHSFVHLTSNKVILRFSFFAISWIILVAMWVAVFIRVLLLLAGV